MKKYIRDLKVKSVERLNAKYVLLKLTDCEPLPEILPGQFVEVRVDNAPQTFLRRPISINFVDRAANELWLLVAIVGDGTRHIAALREGDTLNCVLPLGNGFTMPTTSEEQVLLVGGGVGVAPLLYTGAQMAKMGCRPTFLLGARTKADLLEINEFEKYGRLCITTEDGSEGERGFVTNHSILSTEKFDRVEVCGHKPMMVDVARWANTAGVDCEVSLENMMACGVGACLCCVEKTVKGNVCVCKEGPVFNINQLTWQI